MAPIRHGVITPNWKYKSWDYLFLSQELNLKIHNDQSRIGRDIRANQNGSFKLC